MCFTINVKLLVMVLDIFTFGSKCDSIISRQLDIWDLSGHTTGHIAQQ